MIRRLIDTRPVHVRMAQHRELIRAVAIIGFFLSVLALAILSQVRISERPAAAALPVPVPVPVPTQFTALPSAAPSTQPSASPTAQPAAPAAPPQPPRQPAETVIAIHTVAAGETLAEIALRYGVPFEQIAAQNGITDPNRIGAGQLLLLQAAGPGIQVIQPGANLSGYAQQVGLSVAELMALNPQLSHPDRITAGAALRVMAT